MNLTKLITSSFRSNHVYLKKCTKFRMTQQLKSNKIQTHKRQILNIPMVRSCSYPFLIYISYMYIQHISHEYIARDQQIL